MASGGLVRHRKRECAQLGQADRPYQRYAQVVYNSAFVAAYWRSCFFATLILVGSVVTLQLFDSPRGIIVSAPGGQWSYEMAHPVGVSVSESTAGVLADIAHLPMPWPQYEQGQLGWYRQGLREVTANRALIETLADEHGLSTVLAAAVANQGNSYQRPFGWGGGERVQLWLGRAVSLDWAQWPWANYRWGAWFLEPSVGVGQITPQEVVALGYQLEKTDLFRDPVSIGLLFEKLYSIQHQAAQLQIGPTDTFILVLIGNNSQLNLIETYNEAGRDMALFLDRNEATRRQLAKMVTYIYYLHREAGWPLPQGIDWTYVAHLAQVQRVEPRSATGIFVRRNL